MRWPNHFFSFSGVNQNANLLGVCTLISIKMFVFISVSSSDYIENRFLLWSFDYDEFLKEMEKREVEKLQTHAINRLQSGYWKENFLPNAALDRHQAAATIVGNRRLNWKTEN